MATDDTNGEQFNQTAKWGHPVTLQLTIEVGGQTINVGGLELEFTPVDAGNGRPLPVDPDGTLPVPTNEGTISVMVAFKGGVKQPGSAGQ